MRHDAARLERVLRGIEGVLGMTLKLPAKSSPSQGLLRHNTPMNINRNISHFEPGMPDHPCYVQIPPALGGAMPGERFKATVVNGVSLRLADGSLLYVTGAAADDHVVVGRYNGRTYGTGRKAYVSWPN